MPGVIWEDSIDGLGSAILGGSRVYFVAWELTVIGPTARHPSYWDTDAYVGVGYYRLGNDLTAGGIIGGVGYGEAHWLSLLIGQNVVDPGQVASDFTSQIAQYISWAIAPGNAVHMYVFGDT